MSFNAAVVEEAERIRQAVCVMLNPDPGIPHQLRLDAYQMFESFKESSEQCAQCGVFLALSAQNDHIARHTGIQLIEHCVRFRWNGLSVEEKLYIKENMMKLLREGTLDILTEEKHIKDAVTRVVVEAIKREWPQQWPTMMSELNEIYNHGPTQCELVLLVFLRLAEDVLVFQSVPTQRRREIHQALTQAMPQLFPALLRTLVDSYQAYKAAAAPEAGSSQVRISQVSSHLALVIMETIAAFLDSLPMSLLMEDDGRLAQVLCLMLADKELQLGAAECLIVFTNRKGKTEERMPLLVLFSEEAMTVILSSAVRAAAASVDDRHSYLFLKKLCQVLTQLGSQLCYVWTINSAGKSSVSCPLPFAQYLEAIIAFTTHPSLVLSKYTQSLWTSLMRHEQISKEPVLLSFIPRLIASTYNTMMKVGFPSQSNSPACLYSRLDFESDEEFNDQFSKHRLDSGLALRHATSLCPTEAVQFVFCKINDQLIKGVDSGHATSSDKSATNGHGSSNYKCTSYLEWDVLTVLLDCVMSRFLEPDSSSVGSSQCSTIGIVTPEGFMDRTMELFRAILAYDTADPVILSSLFSMISTLFPFGIRHSPSILSTVLRKIFATAVFAVPGQTKSTRSRAVQNVRRHACSVLVMIAKQYPHLLLPGFEELYSLVKRLSSDPEEMSQMEKCHLTEALILVCNSYKNFERQSKILSEILGPIRDVWMSDEMKQSLRSVDKFITFIGLDQPARPPGPDDRCGSNRSQILFSTSILLAVLRRSAVPEDLQEAIAGGFMFGSTDSGQPVLKNPSMPVVIDMIDNLLVQARTLTELWRPDIQARRHPDYAQALDMLEVDKQVLLGVVPPMWDSGNSAMNREPPQRMQSFIVATHDNCYHALGDAAASLGYEFYRLPNLASSIIGSMLTNLNLLTDFRIRPLIRACLKPFFMSCPKEFYATTIIPILVRLGPFMYQRLCSRWETIHQRLLAASEWAEDTEENQETSERGEDTEDNQETREVLDEQITRLLTREYLELLRSVFIKKRAIRGHGGVGEVGGGGATAIDPDPTVTGGGRDEGEGDDMNMDDMGGEVGGEGGGRGPASGKTEDVIGDLGLLVLENNDVFPSLVLTAFRSLAWSDTAACIRSLSFCFPILKQLVSLEKVSADDGADFLAALLLGLQVHGQHEQTQPFLVTASLQVYELLLFDEKLLKSLSGVNQAQFTEKKKKELFRGLVFDAIGKNIGQQYRKEVHIKNLTPLIRSQRYKTPAIVDTASREDIGLCALFS